MSLSIKSQAWSLSIFDPFRRATHVSPFPTKFTRNSIALAVIEPKVGDQAESRLHIQFRGIPRTLLMLCKPSIDRTLAKLPKSFLLFCDRLGSFFRLLRCSH